MMTPVHTNWSVVPWRRFTEEEPERKRGTATIKGREYELTEAPDEAWRAAHSRYGAQIHDHDRGVTYRATVDPVRNELDYLEVIVHGHIDEHAMRRVPIARIKSVVLGEVLKEVRAAQRGDQAPWLILPGGLSDESKPGEGPSSERVAELLKAGLGRQQIATLFNANVRTVDRWIRIARKEFPSAPQARQGRRNDLSQSSRQDARGSKKKGK